MNSMASLVLQVNATSVNAATISLNQLANAGAQAQSATTNLTSATNSANSSILANQQAWFSNTAAINSSTQAMSHLANGFKSAFFGASIAVGLIELKNHFINLTESLIQTQVQVDKLRNSLNFAVGKSAAVGDLAFIKQSAQDMGLSFVTVTEQYVRLAAASRQTSLEGQKTKDIFTAVSQASTVLGLSADETTGALRAITQMISKNTVMSEELKGQLGERLPGAFQIAARAMGVTTQELNKMLETGKVLAEDFLPKFAAQLLKETAPDIEAASQSMQASLNRLETAWTLFKQAVVKSGLGQSMSNEISGLGNYLSTLSESMDQARASGSGLSGQLMTGLGTALARMPFDAVNTSANLLNGTLNLLSAGTLNLSTNVNILPQMFETSAYASSQLASRLKDAEKDLAQLQAKLAVTPDNIYLKSEAYQAYLLVMQLRDAKKAKDDLTGNAGRGSVNPLTIGQMEEAAAKAQQKIDALMAKSSSVPDAYIKRAKEIAEANKDGAMTAQQLAVALGDLHSLLPKVSSAHTKLSEAQKLVNAGEKAYGDIMAKDTGYAANFTETILAMAAARDKNNWSAEKYNEVVNAYIAMQPGIKALADAEQKEAQAAAKLNTEAVDDLFDAQEKLRLQNEDQIKTGRTMLEQIEFETRLLDMNTQQRAIATLERELERQGIVKGTQAYDAYIAKLREAVAIKDAKEAGIESTKVLADANKKAAEESSKYWEDALMRAFESGKGFFESLWDTIKNTLKTQVLKVLVTGTLSGLGLTDLASAATGGGSSSLSVLSSLSNLPTAIAGLTGSISSFASGFAATWAGGASGAAAFGTGYSAAAAAGTGGSFLTGGSLATTLSNPVTWAVAGVALVAAIAKASKGETRAGGQYGYSLDGATAYNARRGTSVAASGVGATFLEGPSGGDPYGQVVSTAINSTVDHINALFKAIGSTTAISAFQAGYETSEKGRGGVFAGGTLTGGVTFGDSGKGDNYAGTLYDSSKGFNLDAKAAVTALSLDLKQATVEALQAATDMPKAIAQMIKVDAKSLTDEAATALLTSIDALVNDVVSLRGALDTLPFAALRDLSFDAAAGLIAAAGNLESLANNLAGYYDNFYTESEKNANLTSVLATQFSNLGKVMPTDNLREWYRAQVEIAMALDQSIPANAQATASLLALQSGVNQLATSADTAAQKIAEAAARLQADIISAQDSAMSDYMAAQANYASILESEQNAIAAAAEALSTALASAGQGIQSFIDSLLNTPATAKSNYLADLALAKAGDVEASKRLPTSGRAYLDAQINNSATSSEARIAQARMAAELSALPAVKTYQQQLLEAVNGTTAAVQDTKDALSTKLTAELTVNARSEILKLINFVSNTDKLPDDLKAIALADASTFSKTVSFITGSTLTAENMQLALSTETSVIKTFNFVAGSELTNDQKLQAFGVLEDADRTISVVTGSLLDDTAKAQAFGAVADATRTIKIIADSGALAEYKKIALEVTADSVKHIQLAATNFNSQDAAVIAAASSSVTKSVGIALQNEDPKALAIIAAQDKTISTIINASGGVLTLEQRTLLNGIEQYNKDIKIGVKVDDGELSAFQQTLMSIFGTMDITALDAAGIDLSGVISREALDRLNSINAYVQSFDWVNTDLPTRASQMHAVRTTAIAYGVSSQDVATALGVSRATLAGWYEALNVPFFARGTNYLPSDMLAQVHEGERIIPAADNRELMSRLQDPQVNSEALVSEIKALREENRAQSRALVQMQQRFTKLMERWDSNGLPSTRVEV